MHAFNCTKLSSDSSEQLRKKKNQTYTSSLNKPKKKCDNLSSTKDKREKNLQKSSWELSNSHMYTHNGNALNENRVSGKLCKWNWFPLFPCSLRSYVFSHLNVYYIGYHHNSFLKYLKSDWLSHIFRPNDIPVIKIMCCFRVGRCLHESTMKIVHKN